MDYDMVIGFAAMVVWGAMCGVPALAIYNVAMRAKSNWRTWTLLACGLLLWIPLVTLVCLWAVSHLISV